MELREVLRALRSGWWMLFLGALVAVLAAWGVSYLRTPQYTSSLQFFVSTSGSTSTLEAFQGSQLSQQRVTSYAQLLTGKELAERVGASVEPEMTTTEVREAIGAAAVPNTVLIDVEVTDPSAERAREIADAVGEEFPRLVSEIESTAADGESPIGVVVTSSPEQALEPSSPRTLRDMIIAGVLGLLVGAAIAITRAKLDRSVKDPHAAGEAFGAAPIGAVIRDPALHKVHVFDRNGGGRAAEDFRQLRTNLQFLNVDDPPTVIMVSSALPSEGKTTLTVNIGLALAEVGRTVTIIEGDLRRPKVTAYLGMVGGVGLSNVLAGTAELEEVLQHHGDGLLRVLASGPTPPNPGELLASQHMATLVEKLRGENDYVLVDAPPLLPVADASGLAPRMDGVIVSVRYGETRTDQLHQAGAVLDRVGATKLGVVLNLVPPRAGTAHGYEYEYRTHNPLTD